MGIPSLYFCTQPQLSPHNMFIWPSSSRSFVFTQCASQLTCMYFWVCSAWISILMGCPLCPCFLSLMFHGRGKRSAKMEECAVAWHSHLSVTGTGGANDQYGSQSSMFSNDKWKLHSRDTKPKCWSARFYHLESANQIKLFGEWWSKLKSKDSLQLTLDYFGGRNP